MQQRFSAKEVKADKLGFLVFSPLQAVYHNVKPAALQQQLEAVHMQSDKAEIFSQTWATVGPELVEKLKHNIFSPKKVRLHTIQHLTVFMRHLSFPFFL